MIRPDWNVFKAKFKDKAQTNFEWLCYILFCKEFKKPYGIFRYKNQSAIETNPIEVNGKIVGWQAKFYDTPLSRHTKDIIRTLEKAKRYYPNITKVIFYLNQEWGQTKGRGSKPKGLIRVEEKARQLNIELEWKGPSFFESPFVCSENEIIAKHFFAFEKSIFDLIQELQNHTENIFKRVKTSFYFVRQEFGIPSRDERIEQLKNTEAQVVIVSGLAGVGKTATVKKLYEQLKNKVPFYVFEAMEFNNLRNLNEFFKDFDFYEFINAHKEDKEKIIVIDSAEKILYLTNPSPFKEFLQVILANQWKIILTARDNYVNNLTSDFLGIYRIIPEKISIQELSEDELLELSEQYKFKLPSSKKLFALIRIPFYLNEYLKFYTEKEKLDYIEFKDKLWERLIYCSKPENEQCFLQIALDKANEGFFFINPNRYNPSVLNELKINGVLEYESPYGYFITHDIYEEWALGRLIEREFVNRKSIKGFFENLGCSLLVRKSFRNWLSEKLFLDDKSVKQFVIDALETNINQFWKEEILTSVLLSNYSETFFDNFKNELLSNNLQLLKQTTFLLRVACKELDYDSARQLGVGRRESSALIGILMKPIGNGWKSLIKFIFDNIEIIGIEGIDFITEVLYDWNSKFKEGETTRFASLIALKYYKWISEKNMHARYRDAREKLLQTILYGASEIKDELKEIFETILKNEWKHPNDPYYELVKAIIAPNPKNGFAGLEVSKILPSYVLKIADLFWSYMPEEDSFAFHSSKYAEQYHSLDIGRYFGLEETYPDYFPPSAFQTPIFWLLRHSLRETIDFVLEFTNKSIRHYAMSGFDNSVKKVKVYFDDGTIKEQYISHCLWNMYRGTSSPASPYLLQSIHMALEKYLIELGKYADAKTLEGWLLYLLKKTESASITAVVTSIVLAYPDKTFNIAKILFKTKEFILQDKTRYVYEPLAKSLHSIGYGANYWDRIYYNERIKTREDKHRRWCLEELIVYYQVLRRENISEEEARKRQKEVWKILDNYYSQLHNKDVESDEDKKWRIRLAGMDIRKMKITPEETDEGVLIKFDPELEPDLKEYIEKASEKHIEASKYNPLYLWASYKMENDETYEKYKQYEHNPRRALEEARELVKELEAKDPHEISPLNRSILAKVCSTLIKYHIRELSPKEIEFCKDIILRFASLPLQTNYICQIEDGVEPAFSVLPILLKDFPAEKAKIKTIVLLTLFNQSLLGLVNEPFDFPYRTMKELFSISPKDAQSLLFGYLKLKPKYDALREDILSKNYKTGIHQIEENKVLCIFQERYNIDLQKVINNEITYEDIGGIENLDLYTLTRAFQLIPEKASDEILKEIARKIINIFVPKILTDDRNKQISYPVEHSFLRKYAYFVLNSSETEIYIYLKPFLDGFKPSQTIAYLFQEFIYAEDVLNTYNKFWLVWEQFKEKVFKLCESEEEHPYIDDIVKSYLLSSVSWREDVKGWHSLKDENKKFFKDVCQKIGHWPSTLYAIAKLLNGVGSSYIDNGIIWISDIIDKNKDLVKKNLEKNTIYNIENLVKQYIYHNRETIRKTPELKQKLLIILNFLVDIGSVTGYILREDIL